MSVWGELKRRNVFKVGGAYLLVAWLIAQVISIVNDPLSLPEWFDTVVLLLLGIGFPIAVIFAWAYELTPEGLKLTRDVPTQESLTHPTGQKLNYFIVSLLVGLLIGLSSFWFLTRDEDAQWARTYGIPRIEEQIEGGNWEAAFSLAKQVQAAIPEEARVQDLLSRLSWLTTIASEPSGATVYRRPYSSSEADWEVLGQTPLEGIRIPFGLSRLRFELEDHRPLKRSVGGSPDTAPVGLSSEPFKLDTQDSLPEGMVRVPGWSEPVDGQPIEFRDFFLSRYEVTNREYQMFVDAGGYRQQEFWEHDFVREGEPVSWEEAMTLFVDRTGRQGPSTWIAGAYPDGQADYPVGGVSWYEAAAYARFVGQEIPTVYHWRRAFSPQALPWMLSASNIGNEEPTTVGRLDGMSWVEAYDMVGNVREWMFNSTGDGRLVLGAGWNDSAHRAFEPASLPAFDRAETNGFRLAIIQDTRSVMTRARQSFTPIDVTEYLAREPASDEVFDAYRSLFAYDPIPLDTIVESTEEAAQWTRQRVSFSAAYGDERMGVYLFLPRSVQRPYQTVVFWPGAGALQTDSIEQYPFLLDFILKSGRAVAWPVFDKTFERRDGTPFPLPGTTAHRDLLIRNVQDLRRTVDYLETRTDIQSESLAFFGHSWGGALAPHALAIEPRLTVAVLYVGGMDLPGRGPFASETGSLPEVRTVHYLPRVTIPTLMLNGEFDSLRPLETSIRPFFRRLGTAEVDKRLVLAPGSHFVPREVLIRETLEWLDKHLGDPQS